MDTEELNDEEIQDLDEVVLEEEELWFQNVNHSERAYGFGRVSDGNTTKHMNVALEYFGHRCALSGEKFVKFDENINRKNSNLSSEHVIALVQGGHDIVPNLVPSVLQYNIQKNGYNTLDWWKQSKDINGKDIYSPYRLLKIINYMMKSIQAGGRHTEEEEYRRIIMKPNEIDEFLSQIEEQDEQEKDNTKRKIKSDTITATTVDIDNKKILTKLPALNRDMPSAKKQMEELEKQKSEEIEMMTVFLSDAIRELGREKEIAQAEITTEDGKTIRIQDKLNTMFEEVKADINFALEVRKIVIEKLEQMRNKR